MTDRRAVTSTVEFVLTIAIATALIAGLIVAASDTVDRQQTLTAEAQMEIVGQQVAGTIESGDRLVETSASVATLRLEQDLPDRVVRADYAIEITADTVVVRSSITDRPVTVPFDSDTPVAPTRIESGDVAVEYDPIGDELEVYDV